jgi:hypothetical protein
MQAWLNQADCHIWRFMMILIMEMILRDSILPQQTQDTTPNTVDTLFRPTFSVKIGAEF